jgi:RimJ/RimL family protein N-acetyltransferase
MADGGAWRAVVTPRLLLRCFEPADVAAYAAIRAKPEVMRFLAGGEALCATAAADAERIAGELAAQWDAVGYGPWAVVDRASGELLGHAGLRLLPDEGGETEVLYLLDSRVWGRGLATEAALAARDFGFSRLGLPRLVGYALPENRGSARVLEKIGMRREATVAVFGLTGVVRHVVDRAAMAE